MNHDKQCEVLLKELKKRKELTKVEILRLGILNAGGRIYDLREDRYNIVTIMKPVRTRDGESIVAHYKLRRPYRLKRRSPTLHMVRAA